MANTLHIGFTGTRGKVSTYQGDKVAMILLALSDQFPDKRIVPHHGDCVGADQVFHMRCWEQGMWGVIHPPANDKYRAEMFISEYGAGWEQRMPKEYIARNHDIVDEVEYVLAAPRGNQMVWRSGTWATVRYARLRKKPVAIIWPSGLVSWERWDE